MNELVVAHYNEDCSWVKDIPAGWRATIYHKGIDLPNVGREPSTFLHHVVNRYDSLEDVTVFVQGNPFDHCANLFWHLENASWGKAPFMWLGDTNYTSDARGGPHDVRPVAEVASMLKINSEFPVTFARGGQFVVTKEAILRKPRSFYEEALRICVEVEGAPWCYERLWERVFA